MVLEASGRAFSAGHDLREMRSQPSLDYYRELFRKCGAVMQGLQALPVPVIAKVRGIATAAGCQLVASCDLAICADDARFAVSGINVGLFCATPAVALSRNVSAKRAFDMLVTGRFIDAATAADWDWSTTRCPQTNWMRAWLNSPPRSCPRVRPPSAMASACSTSSGRWRWPTPTTTLATSWPAT